MGGDTPGFFAEKIRSVPLVARSATKRERGACPRKGRQPRRSGCAVRPRRTTEHGAGVLAVRRAWRRESDKGLAGQTEPQAPVAKRAAFSAATSESRAAPGVLVARLPAVAKGSPLSRDETLPGTGPLQRPSNAGISREWFPGGRRARARNGRLSRAMTAADRRVKPFTNAALRALLPLLFNNLH